LREAVAVARPSRSKPGDSSLCSEQAPQSQGEIATHLSGARNDSFLGFWMETIS